MRHLNQQQAADYLEAATIDSTTDLGHVITHTGTTAAGVRFMLVNDCHGRTVLTEAA
ncbi:hypothetical protein LLG90_08020 [Aromatoleum toluclasticum]|uniref:hypothetical protein n=1 Tax=Aromatoleum toluclasticum TaxID=92003 RepID=UPI001D18A18E|nr:hypothetical protein [Aromatoleum toluclasticum]MCC4115292.1 hypothetical protein [Aromatoleum toluclasticum]